MSKTLLLRAQEAGDTGHDIRVILLQMDQKTVFQLLERKRLFLKAKADDPDMDEVHFWGPDFEVLRLSAIWELFEEKKDEFGEHGLVILSDYQPPKRLAEFNVRVELQQVILDEDGFRWSFAERYDSVVLYSVYVPFETIQSFRDPHE